MERCKQNLLFFTKQERYRAAMMYMDLTIQMSSNGLRGADLMGMANSVEMRSVFFRRDIKIWFESSLKI